MVFIQSQIAITARSYFDFGAQCSLSVWRIDEYQPCQSPFDFRDFHFVRIFCVGRGAYTVYFLYNFRILRCVRFVCAVTVCRYSMPLLDGKQSTMEFVRAK